MFEGFPDDVRLRVHLEGEHSVYFKGSEKDALQKAKSKETKSTGYI